VNNVSNVDYESSSNNEVNLQILLKNVDFNGLRISNNLTNKIENVSNENAKIEDLVNQPIELSQQNNANFESNNSTILLQKQDLPSNESMSNLNVNETLERNIDINKIDDTIYNKEIKSNNNNNRNSDNDNKSKNEQDDLSNRVSQQLDLKQLNEDIRFHRAKKNVPNKKRNRIRNGELNFYRADIALWRASFRPALEVRYVKMECARKIWREKENANVYSLVVNDEDDVDSILKTSMEQDIENIEKSLSITNDNINNNNNNSNNYKVVIEKDVALKDKNNQIQNNNSKKIKINILNDSANAPQDVEFLKNIKNVSADDDNNNNSSLNSKSKSRLSFSMLSSSKLNTNKVFVKENNNNSNVDLNENSNNNVDGSIELIENREFRSDSLRSTAYIESIIEKECNSNSKNVLKSPKKLLNKASPRKIKKNVNYNIEKIIQLNNIKNHFDDDDEVEEYEDEDEDFNDFN
jgi:hypothetical protein